MSSNVSLTSKMITEGLIFINNFLPYKFTLLNRNELPITETELTLIAAAAIIGDNNNPKKGNKIPAAIGTPTTL